MKTILAIFIFNLVILSCQDYYKDGGIVSTEPLKINTLEFMKSRPDLFDTTLIIIKKSGLTNIISSENVTFFAPQKSSISIVMSKINSFVKNKRDSLGYTKDTVLIDDVPSEKWAQYLSKYIFKGQHLRDNITKGKMIYEDNKTHISGGEMVNSWNGYPMMMFCDWTDWENVPEAGPRYIYLVDTKGENPTIPKEIGFPQASIITSNILTSSGAIHVLNRTHEFGFGNSDKFIPAQQTTE